MKTLLVPVDLSDAAQPVLQKAAELAPQLSARIVRLHIVEPVATYVPVGATMDVIAGLHHLRKLQKAFPLPDSRLKALAEPVMAAGINVEAVTLIGLAVDDDCSNRPPNIVRTSSCSDHMATVRSTISSAAAWLPEF